MIFLSHLPLPLRTRGESRTPIFNSNYVSDVRSAGRLHGHIFIVGTLGRIRTDTVWFLRPLPFYQLGYKGKIVGAGSETRTHEGFPTAYKTVPIATMGCRLISLFQTNLIVCRLKLIFLCYVVLQQALFSLNH